MGAVPARPENPGAGERRPPASRARSPAVGLKRFLRGCQHALLYAPGHPEFESALQLTLDGCTELLARFPICTLRHDPLGLWLMDDLCPPEGSPERLAARLRDRGIPAVTLTEGVTREEILVLLQLLQAEPAAIIEHEGAEAWLARSGVQHISLQIPRTRPSGQAQWEAFLAAQQPADRGAYQRLLDLCPETARGALPGNEELHVLAWLIDALGEAAAALPDESLARVQWLHQTSRAIGEFTPALRGRLFRVPAPGAHDVLRDIAAWLPPETAAEILVSYPNAVVGEPSEQLETVLQRLLPEEERARQVEPQAKAMLLARGMTEESYQSVVALLLRKRAPAAVPRPDRVPSRGGIQRVSLLTDLLASTSPRALRESQVDMWVELILAPGQGRGRDQVVRNLAESLPASLAERTDERAVALLRRVEAAITSGLLSPAERRLLRAQLICACSPELCGRLARLVMREPSPENDTILQLLSQAETGFDALVQIAKHAPTPGLQSAAGLAILHMGERSLEACRRKLAAGPVEEAAALARALVLSGAREGLERALWAQEHPETIVAATLMEALARSRDPRAERVLINALRQGSPEVQPTAAWALGYHPSDHAVAALSTLLASPLGSRRVEVVKPALEALGRIGRSEAIPALRAVLRRRNLLFRGHAKELRELACRALANIPDPAAEQALRDEAREDPEGLAEFCEQALTARRLVPPEEATRESA